MLISHKYKFIYVKTKKTAGTSVEAYFEKYCMPEGEWSPSHTRDEYISDVGVIGLRGSSIGPPEWWHHMSAELIREKIGYEIWKNYFKFCVVRNPYEKAISAFFHFKAKNWDGIGDLKGTDQEKFEQWLELVGPPIDRDCYLIDNEICIDFFVFYETLHDDLSRVCSLIGVPWNPNELQKYKSGFKPYPVVAADFYTPKARTLIEKIYDLELKCFGYKFPQK